MSSVYSNKMNVPSHTVASISYVIHFGSFGDAVSLHGICSVAAKICKMWGQLPSIWRNYAYIRTNLKITRGSKTDLSPEPPTYKTWASRYNTANTSRQTSSEFGDSRTVFRTTVGAVRWWIDGLKTCTTGQETAMYIVVTLEEHQRTMTLNPASRSYVSDIGRVNGRNRNIEGMLKSPLA